MRYFLILAGLLLVSCNDHPTDGIGSSPGVSSAPIHEWTFDSVATDSGTVGGWNATMNGLGDTSYDTIDYKQGTASIFMDGGTSDNFDIGTQTLPTQMSIAIWFRIECTGDGVHAIFANSASGTATSGLRIYINDPSDDGNFTVYAQTGNGTSGSTIQSTATYNDTTGWHHLVVTVNSTTGAAAIYVDGASQSSGTLTPSFILSGDLIVGQMHDGDANEGLLDDLQIYNQILTGSEVLQLYNSYPLFIHGNDSERLLLGC